MGLSLAAAMAGTLTHNLVDARLSGGFHANTYRLPRGLTVVLSRVELRTAKQDLADDGLPAVNVLVSPVV